MVSNQTFPSYSMYKIVLLCEIHFNCIKNRQEDVN